MPVARGIMIMDRINVRPTTVAFTQFSYNPGAVVFIPPGPVPCGSTITVTVRVIATAQAGLPAVHPAGIVNIVDTVTLLTVGTGTLAAAGPGNASDATIILSIASASNNNLQARYAGVFNTFAPSNSAVTLVNISLTASNTTLDLPAAVLTNTCVSSTVNLRALVESGGNPVTSGTVQFRLFSDEISSIALASGSLNGSGQATSTIPAFSMVAPSIYGVQALFNGSACISISQTLPGVTNANRRFRAVQNDVTSTNPPAVVGPATFCRKKSKQFTVHVDGTLLADPSIGTVTLTGAPYPALTPVTTLGSGTPTNGNVTITVPASTFPPPAGTFYVFSAYTGDGYCYSDSDALSSGLSVTTTDDSTTTVINSVVPSTFSRTSGGNVTVTCTVTSGTPGTIGGTMDFGESIVPLGSQTVTAGSCVFVVAKTAFTAIGTFPLIAFYNGDGAGPNCYGESSDTFSVTVSA